MADMDYPLKEYDDTERAQPEWNLHQIVGQLRSLRTGWRQSTKPDGVTYELPSQEALSDILEGLSAALFPRHFGPAGLTEEAVDHFIARTLDRALQSLYEQIRRELRLASGPPVKGATQLDTQAREITRAFAAILPVVRGLLETDILAAYQGDPAARNIDEVLFCYPGIAAIARHRLAHELYLLGAPLLARIISELAHSATGIDIHPGARIGGSFFIDHGTGVVIGETCIIGERVRLYQGVTLGAKSFPTDNQGRAIKGRPRHPIVEDDVTIYAGATILGRITIGRGSSIGGNVWLTESVAPGSRVTQAKTQTSEGGHSI